MHKVGLEALCIVEAFPMAVADCPHTAAVLGGVPLGGQTGLRLFLHYEPLDALIQFHSAQTVAMALER